MDDKKSQICKSLRARGFRITPQREMIIDIVIENNNHITPEDIHTRLARLTQAINLTTVYRTLDFLFEEGLIQRTVLRGITIYTANEHGKHLHLVCRRCGKVIAADQQQAMQLAQQIVSEYQFQPDLDHIAIFGVCATCQELPTRSVTVIRK